jgi:hypothetical protein
MFSFFSINSTDFPFCWKFSSRSKKKDLFFSSLIFESLFFKNLLFLLFFSVFSFSFSFRYLTRGLTQGESEVHETRHNGDLLFPLGTRFPALRVFLFRSACCGSELQARAWILLGENSRYRKPCQASPLYLQSRLEFARKRRSFLLFASRMWWMIHRKRIKTLTSLRWGSGARV